MEASRRTSYTDQAQPISWKVDALSPPPASLKGTKQPNMVRTGSLAVLLVALAAHAQPPRGRKPGADSYRIEFGNQLKLQGDLRLQGTTASRALEFTCESVFKPTRASALHLFLEHSPALDGNRSFLSVSLNYGALRSVRLDELNQAPNEIVIPLPPELLKPENVLTFSVEQFPTAKTHVWTVISMRSYIAIEYEPGAPALDLSLLPAPLIDKYSYREKAFDVLLPERAAPETVEALAVLVANFCNRVAPEPVAVNLVSSIGAARNSLLVVGTVAEQPQLRILESVAPFVIREWPGSTVIGLKGGELLQASEGLVGLTTTPGEQRVPVLFVTADSPAGVLRATRDVALPIAHLSGILARISTDANSSAMRARQWKGHLPPESRFSLASLNLRRLQLSAENDFSLVIS